MYYTNLSKSNIFLAVASILEFLFPLVTIEASFIPYCMFIMCSFAWCNVLMHVYVCLCLFLFVVCRE
jgi:hypothetical protein